MNKITLDEYSVVIEQRNKIAGAYAKFEFNEAGLRYTFKDKTTEFSHSVACSCMTLMIMKKM